MEKNIRTQRISRIAKISVVSLAVMFITAPLSPAATSKNAIVQPLGFRDVICYYFPSACA